MNVNLNMNMEENMDMDVDMEIDVDLDMDMDADMDPDMDTDMDMDMNTGSDIGHGNCTADDVKLSVDFKDKELMKWLVAVKIVDFGDEETFSLLTIIQQHQMIGSWLKDRFVGTLPTTGSKVY